MTPSQPEEEPGTRTHRCVFLGQPDQIGEVRGFIRDHLVGHHRLQDITLVASELTTNAWEHTRSRDEHGTFSVCAQLRSDDTIRLEVADKGGPFVFGPAKADDEGGRGLCLVDALTSEWGVAGDERGRIVWAEFK